MAGQKPVPSGTLKQTVIFAGSSKFFLSEVINLADVCALGVVPSYGSRNGFCSL